MLGRGLKMVAAGLFEDAGRAAYLAAFHAAQGFLRSRLPRLPKTHAGVQSEFVRVSRGLARLDGELRSFLARSYDLKATADYEVGDYGEPTEADALVALDEARRFVEALEQIGDEGPSDA